jgi:hypothetical protein
MLTPVSLEAVREFIEEVSRKCTDAEGTNKYYAYHYNRLKNEDPLFVQVLDTIKQFVGAKDVPDGERLVRETSIFMYRILEQSAKLNMGGTLMTLAEENTIELQNVFREADALMERITKK